MKKTIAAVSLAVAAFASSAAVINPHQTPEGFPTIDGTLGNVTSVRSATGGNGDGFSLTYIFDAHTAYAGFNFATWHINKLFATVTAADNTAITLTKDVTGDATFWGFSVEGSDLQSVEFFSTVASSNNVNNDKIEVQNSYGFIKSSGGPANGEVPEPSTVALLGLGLLGFAVSRRRFAKK